MTPEERPRNLACDPRLNHRRVLGDTWLSALCAAQHRGDKARMSSKLCGLIKRVALVGLLGWEVERLKTAEDAARAMALMELRLVDGMGLPKTFNTLASGPVDLARRQASRWAGAEEALQLLLLLQWQGFGAGLRSAATYSGGSTTAKAGTLWGRSIPIRF